MKTNTTPESDEQDQDDQHYTLDEIREIILQDN
jgi:hypothetical protein